MRGEIYLPTESNVLLHPNSQNQELTDQNNLQASIAKTLDEQRLLTEVLKNRNEKIDYRANLLGFGVLTHVADPTGSAEHTSHNDHLFQFNTDRGIFEVYYQSSATIVDILELNMLGRDKRDHPQCVNAGEPRKLAFIEKNGDFTDQAMLIDLELYIKKNGKTSLKHTAVFEYEKNGALETRPVPIDDIYCVSLAIPNQQKT